MENIKIDYVKTGIRLAIRGEGAHVNAYLAQADSMEGAMLLGSMKRKVCERFPDIFNEWKALMARVVSRTAHEVLGVEPRMIEEPAPIHERAGRA